jgi:hypothetical protein
MVKVSTRMHNSEIAREQEEKADEGNWLNNIRLSFGVKSKVISEPILRHVTIRQGVLRYNDKGYAAESVPQA